jgi:hypothetical protein
MRVRVGVGGNIRENNMRVGVRGNIRENIFVFSNISPHMRVRMGVGKNIRER